jgi:hypothetical protein
VTHILCPEFAPSLLYRVKSYLHFLSTDILVCFLVPPVAKRNALLVSLGVLPSITIAGITLAGPPPPPPEKQKQKNSVFCFMGFSTIPSALQFPSIFSDFS